jgi:hypothetical protein
MKKLLQISHYHLLLVLSAAVMLFAQSGCKKEASSSTGMPAITSIRNYVAHPGDSLLSKIGTGQWVVISGHNLKGALNIYFDGVAASFNDAWFSDTSAIALIPAVIAFPTVAAKQLNTIRYVTTHGETTFSFPIVAPAPTISGISNEDANPGDSVTINGLNFFYVQSLTYAGLPVTGYTSSNDGTAIKLVVPAAVTQTGGIVSVTTKTGSAATVYKVHNFVDGVLNNYDNVNNFSWGSGSSNNSATYPGNNGNYGIMNASNVGGGDGSWWNWARSINLNPVQWVPVANLQDAVGNYALKFEISVTTPWTGGTIGILKDYSWNYAVNYNPWKKGNGSTTAFTTKGWQTVTMPLSSFVDSKGLPAASLTDLLGSGGAGGLNFFFVNNGTTTVASFEAAIDNIRIVKVK